MHLLKIRYGAPLQNWRPSVCWRRGLDRDLWGLPSRQRLPLREPRGLTSAKHGPEAPPNCLQMGKVERVGPCPHGVST